MGPVEAPPLRPAAATTTTRQGRMEVGGETEGGEELFTSAVSLCVALASTHIGAAALLEAQVILIHTLINIDTPY